MRSSRRSPTPTNSSTTSNKSQQLIVFPAKANRDSPAISTLQRSLAEFGVDCVFQDLESSSYDQLIPYSYAESNEEQIVHSTILWESPMLSLGSELLFSLRKAGWKPTYTRTSRKGQTHFLGSQPLHTYFFQADYKPQFTTSTITPSDESIAIHSALVEKYALIELGFLFKLNETGFYILDGRLSYDDIEALVERSFLLRENNYRRLHRPLQSHYDTKPTTTATTPTSTYCHTYASSLASTSTTTSTSTSIYNPTTCGETSLDTESDDASTTPSENHYGIRDVKRFLVPSSETSGKRRLRGGGVLNRDDDDVPSLDRGEETPIESPSVVSIASKSTNPFRKHVDVKDGGDGGRGEFGFPSFVVWDGGEGAVTLISLWVTGVLVLGCLRRDEEMALFDNMLLEV
ncbi:hypothetical protein PtrSN002B_007914 [Pyrenophora tritici-repentis]|nr:hypothetical protein PtrSN002B_007914 [Pyrenophora tritici-repentis]